MTHHLYNTPGHNDDLGSLSTRQLFQLILQRSYQELCGAAFHTERKLFNFQGKELDVRASVLKPDEASNCALLAFKDHEIVYKYKIEDGVLNLQRRLASPAIGLGKTEVLCTAEGLNRGRSGIYVLHRFKPFIDQELDNSHPFIQQAMKSSPNGNIFLAFHEEYTKAILLYDFPEEKDYEPLALAALDWATETERFAISWQHRQLSDDHHVVLYTLPDLIESEDEDEDEDEEDDGPVLPRCLSTLITIQFNCFADVIVGSDYYPYVLTETIEAEASNEGSSNEAEEKKRPTAKLAFNDEGGQLLHYHRGQTLYGSFQKLHTVSSVGQAPSQPKSSYNACPVRFSDSLSLQFSIDIPFFSTHEEGNPLAPGGRCHWQYLAVGIATHRVEHWTVACLLKSEARCLARHCDHRRNLDRGRRFNHWQVMARLDRYRESNTSHGSLVTASRMGTRIAAASWKTITIWSLKPDVLVEGDTGGYYPESWKTPDGVTELPPIVIELDAVCSQLSFAYNEDELFAITDRGLMYLNIKPDGKGVEVTENCATVNEGS